MTEARWFKTNNGIEMYNSLHRLLVEQDRQLSARKVELRDEALRSFELGRGRPSKELADYLREQLGNPFRPYRCEPAWRTETVLALASGIEAELAFDRMPILADALEEAGCDEQSMLDHLRASGPHAHGCWVLDLILDREPELFSQPPLVPTPRRMKLGPFTPAPEGMA